MGGGEQGLPAGGGGGGGGEAAPGTPAGKGGGVGAVDIARIAALMKIGIGEAGGAEEREHIERVRKMIAYFDVLDRAGAGGGGWGPGGDGDGDGDDDDGLDVLGVAIGELRADEPEEGGGGGGRAPAASYARVQEEGGAYVRAPQMSP